MKNNKELIFLCGARDYHAMDWYGRAVESMGHSRVSIMTDLIESEGFLKLVNSNDRVYKMIIIDAFLFKTQSSIGNIWRNIVKMLVLPFQVLIVIRFAKKNKNTIFYAHSMYYVLLAHLSKVEFIGRPQGSDILIKPFKSRIYKNLSIASMKSAKYIILDSERMKKTITTKMSSHINTIVIPNGIDLKSINSIKNLRSPNKRSESVLSLRGMTPLYRIKEILKSRSYGNLSDCNLSFIYPFHDSEYKSDIDLKLRKYDLDLGRLEKDSYYNLLLSTLIVISIPVSDSSPRSVFEAIFCGCIVIITHSQYYDVLPECMKSRVVVVNLENANWFKNAINSAKLISKKKFIPTNEALHMFDQNNTFGEMYKCIFND